MTDGFEDRKARASAWFRALRDDIVSAFEGLEDSHGTGPQATSEPGRFEVSETRRATDDGSDAGGGLMSVMRDGRVFEKVGVNVSTVYGTLGDRAEPACASGAYEHADVLDAWRLVVRRRIRLEPLHRIRRRHGGLP